MGDDKDKGKAGAIGAVGAGGAAIAGAQSLLGLEAEATEAPAGRVTSAVDLDHAVAPIPEVTDDSLASDIDALLDVDPLIGTSTIDGLDDTGLDDDFTAEHDELGSDPGGLDDGDGAALDDDLDDDFDDDFDLG